MFNYQDLNDYEFEVLCRDIMEKKLGIELRNFGKGVDGGIDLLDMAKKPNVVVQVKHYIKSRFSNLRTTLKNEVDKVKRINPKSYYVCCSCSQSITSNNINEIYNLFEDYMESKDNIMTIEDIDKFLNEPCNVEIVRKNFKLWISASNILSEIFNQNIFIDCDVLLSDIAEESKYFVQTDLYEKSKKILDNRRAIIIVGSPGVGKTTLSKMLILYYATQGYKVRYTTNGEISDIKRALSSDKDDKEVVLLDDCLGQCYFKIEETQEEELISLIKYIKNNPNKILILNSRVTIFNEAKEKSQSFERFIDSEKIKVHVIDMDNMKTEEKARILFNHIYFNEVPKEYYASLRKNKNYKNIICHKNYNPRIIQYVTEKHRYINEPPENYYNFIMKSLENPKDVWKNEFVDRIKIQDRILMLILYSLTENRIEYSVLEECYNKRLSLNDEIDTSINNFEAVISRLNKSMINVIYDNGEKCIGVLNPSINDYLNSIFWANVPELEKIKKSIIYYEQIERCYKSKEEINNVLLKTITDGTIMNIKMLKKSEYGNINNLITYKICENSIVDDKYVDLIHSYIFSIVDSANSEKINKTRAHILQNLLKEPLCTAYDICKFIYNNKLIDLCYMYLENKEILIGINKIWNKAKEEYQSDKILLDLKEDIVRCIKNQIDSYLENFDIDEFLDEFDIYNYAIENEEIIHDDNGEYIGTNKEDLDINSEELESDAKEEFFDDINGFFKGLNIDGIEEEIKEYIISEIDVEDYIFKSAVESHIETFFESVYDDYYEDYDDDYDYVPESGECCSEYEAFFENYE